MTIAIETTRIQDSDRYGLQRRLRVSFQHSQENYKCYLEALVAVEVGSLELLDPLLHNLLRQQRHRHLGKSQTLTLLRSRCEEQERRDGGRDSNLKPPLYAPETLNRGLLWAIRM
jgi:hypothetical protein